MKSAIIFLLILSNFNLRAQSILLSNSSLKINSNIIDNGIYHSINSGESLLFFPFNNLAFLNAFNADLNLAVNNGPASVKINGTNIENVNYTALGLNAPLIKTKEFTGVTPAFDGSSSSSSVIHGVDYTKILSVNVELSVPASGVIPARTYPEEYTVAPGYQVSFFINGGGIIVINSNGNSFNVRNMPFKVYITYEQ
jgi:hypothetical protein